MPFHPDILNCCLYVSDNYWKKRFRELAYKDIQVDDKYYHLQIGDETVRVIKYPPELLVIELLNHFHDAGEHSPKEEVPDSVVPDKWSSIKSRNIKEALLLEYSKKHPEDLNNVIQTILGNIKVKTVSMKRGRINHIEFKNIEDKQKKTKEKTSSFESFVKKFQQVLTTKFKL